MAIYGGDGGSVLVFLLSWFNPSAVGPCLVGKISERAVGAMAGGPAPVAGLSQRDQIGMLEL